MYKALWSTQDASTASGSGVDLAAAIDRAVADGVDVINYSISGTTNNFLDGAEIAFLYAAAAGVFVSASAGNSGPARRRWRTRAPGSRRSPPRRTTASAPARP